MVATWPFDAIRRADGPRRPASPEHACPRAPLARLEIDDAATIAGGDRALHRRSMSIAAARGRRAHRVLVGGGHRLDRRHGRLRHPLCRRSAGAAGAVFGRAADGRGGRPAGARNIRRQGLRGARGQGGVREPWSRSSGSRAASSIRSKRTCCRAGSRTPSRCRAARSTCSTGCCKRRESPDEVAGILAHELGHVHHRHSMRALIHNGGTSFLIGLLLGDITGGGARHLRDAPTAAGVAFARGRAGGRRLRLSR